MSESFLAETPFDVFQNFGMSRFRLIEDVFESEIRGAKVVTEVLCKDRLRQQEDIKGDKTRTYMCRPRPAQRVGIH